MLEEVKGKKVCLLTDHHISLNPRLWKEAFFYENRGFEVVILSMWQSTEFLKNDFEILHGHAIEYKAYLNLLPGRNRLSHFLFRLRKRMAGELQKWFKIGISYCISYAPELMVKYALLENADLYAAHLECAFYAGRKLIRAGKKVSFDFEDWYSHDYLVPERPVKLLASLEKFALQKGLFCTAASRTMADGLLIYHKEERPITVIYNGFSKSENKRSGHPLNFSPEKANPKLIWFSRNIGPGRGIEFFLKALHNLSTPLELHLAGIMQPGYKEFLERNFPYQNGHQLIIHAFMPHNKLQNFIEQHAIGLAVEENINDNRKLTITNKMLQYLQAGLQVLASDTTGQQEVANFFPNAVVTVDIENPEKVANALSLLIKRISPRELIIDNFNKTFSWEAQEIKLIKLIKNSLEHQTIHNTVNR